MNFAIHSLGKKPNAVSVSTGKRGLDFAILSLSRKENAVEFKRAGCSIRSSGKEMRFTRLSNIAMELDFQSALQEK